MIINFFVKLNFCSMLIFINEYIILIFVGYLLLKLDDIVNRLVTCSMPVPTTALLDGHTFLLPAKCRFLLSDISNVTPLLSGMLYVIFFIGAFNLLLDLIIYFS